MKLTNNLKLIIQSDDEQFVVEAICNNDVEANRLCSLHKDWGVIGEDEAGHILLANVWPRRQVKVTFANGDTISTWINGTVQTIKDYYLRQSFNLGVGDKDNMQRATRVEFLDNKIV